MSFIENLIKKLKNKGLSDSTITLYIRHLQILSGDDNFSNFNFLKNYDEIDDKIKSKKLNTQKSYYISITSVLLLDEEKNKKLIEHYRKKMMDLNQQIGEELKKNEKSETQEKNWIDFKEIEKKLDELKDEVESYEPDNMDKNKYKVVLSMVVLSLYVLQPPRRNKDYLKMKIAGKKLPNDNFNYLLYSKQQFIFRDYKTSKTELKEKKELVLDINDDLFDNINLYLKFHPLLEGKNIKDGTFFLVDWYGTELKNSNQITYILNDIFGKNLSSSLIRHIYTSHKYGDVLEQMKKDSEAMSHGLNQQREYIKK